MVCECLQLAGEPNGRGGESGHRGHAHHLREAEMGVRRGAQNPKQPSQRSPTR